MEDKINAIYVMVRNDELRAEDGDSNEGLLERQKQECLKFLEQTLTELDRGPVEFYTRRGLLLMDVERERIQRIVVRDLNRLGTSQEELDGLRFELDAAGVELLTVNP